MKVPLVCLLLMLIYTPVAPARVRRKLIMSKTSHIKYLTPDNHKQKKVVAKQIKKKKERRLTKKAHTAHKNKLKTTVKKKKERKLFTLVNPVHEKRLKDKRNHDKHQKLIKKMELERKLKKMKSFRVPKGHHPRALTGHNGKERKTNDDDPTAGEEKIESIPLLLFGDYEIIIEKK